MCKSAACGRADLVSSPSDDACQHPRSSRDARVSRRRFLATTIAGASSALGLAGYGFGVEPRWLRVERRTLRLPGLPKGFDRVKLAHLSDLHRSAAVSARYIGRAVDMALALGPDFAVLTGDYVTGKASFVHSIEPALKRLATRVQTFAVLGNHDHWTGPVTIATSLSRCGINMLTNTAVRLDRGGEYVWLMGTDDFMVGADNLPAALAQVKSPGLRVLITHNPDAIYEVADAGIDLMLCGHTHGGQVALPFVGPLLVPSQYGARFAAGLYRVKRTQLYVNRGVGLISPPVRLGVRPEVTLFTLRTLAA